MLPKPTKPLLEINEADLLPFFSGIESELLGLDLTDEGASAKEALESARRSHSQINVEDFLTEGASQVLDKRTSSSLSRVEKKEKSNSITDVSKRHSKGRTILSSPINNTLGVLQTGLAIGMHLVSLYKKSSGLDSLERQYEEKTLSTDGQLTYREKQKTAAAIQVFSTAYYVVWSLLKLESEKLDRLTFKCEVKPEVYLYNPTQANRRMIKTLALNLSNGSIVKGDWDFMKMTLEYFKAVLEELKLSLPSLEYTGPFIDNDYRLIENGFFLSGFETNLNKMADQVEARPIKFSNIVGNHVAIHELNPVCAKLFLYDFERKKNPLLEFGGFPYIMQGEGVPGTGKTMLIAAMINRCREIAAKLLAAKINVPFFVHPFPKSIVSKYQGETGTQTIDWFKVLNRTDMIILAYMDDCEAFLESITSEVSEGVKLIRSVYLEETEGATKNWLGNAIMLQMTNNPDMIDSAIRSRTIKVFPIDGSTRQEDWIDQDMMQLERLNEIDPKLVDMEMGSDYEPLSAQKDREFVKRLYEAMSRPKNTRFLNIFDRVYEKHKGKKRPPEHYHVFFADLDMAISEEWPLYRNRDKRNIQTAIDNRVMDFSVPEKWFDEPDKEYFALTGPDAYDKKKAMILELIRGNLGGKSIARIKLEETIRYVDNFIRVLEKGRERQIQAVIEQNEVRDEAFRRMAAKKIEQQESST